MEEKKGLNFPPKMILGEEGREREEDEGVNDQEKGRLSLRQEKMIMSMKKFLKSNLQLLSN